MSNEEAERKITNSVKEFFSVRDVEEGKAAFEALPESRRGECIKKMVDEALQKKEAEVKLLGELLDASAEANILTTEMIESAFKDTVDFLEDLSIDVPNAFKYVAHLLVQSGLSREKIEAMSSSMEGIGDSKPAEMLMKKVDEEMEG